MNNIINNNNDDISYFSLENYETLAYYYKNYDGDSIDLIFYLPLTNKKYKWKCRLFGIDTPEIRTNNLQEKEFALKIKNIVREKLENKTLFIKCGSFDKYGRILVEIYTPYNIDLEGKSLNTWLIDNNYAKKYDGGTKEIWTF